MAILVKHRKSGNEYILLKIDTIGSKSSIPVRLLEDFFAKNEAEITNLATICDVKGNIFVVSIDNLIVTEIDGRKPNEILPEIVVPSVSEEHFPEDDLEEQPEKSFSRKIDSTDNPSKFDGENLDEELEEDEDWI